MYKAIFSRIFAIASLIVALVFFWARFSNGLIEVTIGDREPELVTFKPPHSLEYALVATFLCVVFYGLSRFFEKRAEKVSAPDKIDKCLNPDEWWSEYLDPSLRYIGTYEKDRIKAYLEELGKYFQKYKLYFLDEISEYSIKIELRGQMRDYPVKLNFSAFNELILSLKADIFPAYLQIYKQSGLFSEEKAKSCQPEYLETYISDYAKVYSHFLRLNYDLGKIPVHKDHTDPWNKDDLLRIFLANGVFIEGYEEISNLHLAVFQSFSKEFQAVLLENIIGNRINYIQLSSEKIELCIQAGQILEKPITSVNEGLNLLRSIAEEFETVPPSGKLVVASDKNAPAQKVRLVTCRYCTSKYPLTDECKCPNCGAPFS